MSNDAVVKFQPKGISVPEMEVFMRFQNRLEASIRRILPESVRGISLDALIEEAKTADLHVIVQFGKDAAILINSHKRKIFVDQHYLDLFFATEVLGKNYEILDAEAEFHFIDTADFDDQAIDLKYLEFDFVMAS